MVGVIVRETCDYLPVRLVWRLNQITYLHSARALGLRLGDGSATRRDPFLRRPPAPETPGSGFPERWRVKYTHSECPHDVRSFHSTNASVIGVHVTGSA